MRDAVSWDDRGLRCLTLLTPAPPAAIVRGLNTASDPLATRPLSQLGAVLHLASRLADMAFSNPEIIDALPQEVISALDLNLDWMRNKLPERESFLDLSAF